MFCVGLFVMCLNSVVYTVAMFGHVLTFMVFYYVCHLRLSYSVYLLYSSVYVFVLFYGPCCLIQIND